MPTSHDAQEATLSQHPPPFLPLGGLDEAGKRRVIWAVGIEGAMFLVEMLAGQAAGSQALKADSLTFLAAALTQGLSFWAIGRTTAPKAIAALGEAAALVLIGLGVAGATLYHCFAADIPDAAVMGAVGLLALLANLAVVTMLESQRRTYAAVAAIWLRARNDGIGNVAVLAAAIAVYVMGNRGADLVVGGVIVALFLTTAGQRLRRADLDWKAYRANLPVGLKDGRP